MREARSLQPEARRLSEERGPGRAHGSSGSGGGFCRGVRTWDSVRLEMGELAGVDAGLAGIDWVPIFGRNL